MILLTGATGLIGSAVLPRLTAARLPVRCLVRDPGRLGPERVRVQLALGDLADPASFRNALRGVQTVVHLAGATRDRKAGSIEELNGIATWRLVQAAERAGVRRFVFLGALGASPHHRSRLMRARALAEQAVRASGLGHTVLATGLVYAPGDRLLSLLGGMGLLPAVPIAGRGRTPFEPIWASDVADCVVAAVTGTEVAERLELAGPERLTHAQVVALALGAAGHRRPLVPVPSPLVNRVLRAGEALAKSRTPVTWDEAELLQVPMLSASGTADAEALGVLPARMAAVLGVS